MASYQDIMTLLTEQLYGLSNLPPVVWPNTEYTSEEDVLYLEVYLQPAESENHFLGDYAPTYEPGNFQINVVEDRGVGFGTAYEWVDKIVGHFKRGTTLTNSGVDINVRIQKAFPRPEFYNPDGRYVVPIDIRYICFMPI